MDKTTEVILRRRAHGLYLSRTCPGLERLSHQELDQVIQRVVALMEDGVYSRAEMRTIFAEQYDPEVVEQLFSPWGGVFVTLARQGRVAFRSMTSRDFDLISAEPVMTAEEALPELLRRYFRAYGPATLADASWFFGLHRAMAKELPRLLPEGLSRMEYGKAVYYYEDDGEPIGDIPGLTLLSGFDPYLVSYTDRTAALPPEYKAAVILKSGICLPSIAIDGQVAGVWNIKKNQPVVEFFAAQPKRVKDAAMELVEQLRWRTAGHM